MVVYCILYLPLASWDIFVQFTYLVQSFTVSLISKFTVLNTLTLFWCPGRSSQDEFFSVFRQMMSKMCQRLDYLNLKNKSLIHWLSFKEIMELTLSPSIASSSFALLTLVAM